MSSVERLVLHSRTNLSPDYIISLLEFEKRQNRHSFHLLNRAFNLPSTTDGKSKEIQHVRNALKANGYPSSIISNILKKKKKLPTQTIPTPEELVGMFFKWADPLNTSPDFACIPFINGLMEPLTRLFRNNGI